MSARDVFHQAVRVALEKDNWLITHDPLYIKISGVEFYIDLGAEPILGAEKDGQKIAVEIKSFVGESEVTDFHLALGQILNYRLALKKKETDRTLYLAIPQDIYTDFFTRQFIQDVIDEYQVKLIVFHPMREEIVLWKE